MVEDFLGNKINNSSSNSNQLINFYGRTTGHLSKKAKHLLDNLLPNYLLNIKDLDSDSFYNYTSLYQEVNLEIGFGSGDFIFNSSVSNPSKFYLGVEVFLNGIASLLEKIESYTSLNNNLKNVKIYNSNIYHLLDKFKENTFDNIYILFPDPWPKKKHHKRRLINQSNLILFSKILKKEGTLRFVSDHEDYVAWALENFLTSTNFKLKVETPKDFLIAPKDHFQTKYQRKAEALGKTITYINCKNIK